MPQIGGMYEGDRSRKQTLVDYGFRLPERARQPPADVRRVPVDHAADGVRVGDAGRVRARRTPADVVEQIVRPTGIVDPLVDVRETRNQIDDLMNEIRKRVDRDERDAGHHAHQEDERGPHRLPARDGLQGPLPALRDRHARAHPDHPRPAPGRVRRARRREPPARGPRPARGLARRDPRRRQGGLPPRRDLADPDDRPRGPQRRGHGDHVRRQGDRRDARGARRDRPPPRDPGRLQRGARHHARRRSSRASPTSPSSCSRGVQDPRQARRKRRQARRPRSR